jgi:hypothetical protein
VGCSPASTLSTSSPTRVSAAGRFKQLEERPGQGAAAVVSFEPLMKFIHSSRIQIVGRHPIQRMQT